MNRNDNDGVSDTDDPGQPGVSSQHEDRLTAVQEKNITRREDVVIDDEAAVLRRDKLLTEREDAVHLREEEATSRERGILAAETMQAKSDDHMIMLQQANARLVVAAIEAQELAEQLQTAKAQMESAKLVAEKANLAKSEFLSSMSHELRTPLNAILGFAQLLESGSPPPTAVQAVKLQQIIKAGWYLLELINEILDLAQIESGKLSLSLEPVSLAEVMHECQTMIEPQAQKRDISVAFPQFEIPYFVQVDRTRVKQALINLLSNAIKYNKVGGTVTVDCIVRTPGRIRISVEDTGEGLSADKLKQLFQPFNRLGQEANAEEGTGIGLVVCKRLIELMGGVIGVESTVGKGSVFWIELNQNL